MSALNEAIERIKILECPTGKLENRVLEILKSYKISEDSNVAISRDDRFDKDNAQAYFVNLKDKDAESMIILAESGIDDYVAKVVDVYLN